jgi:cell shape-determining protein MreC
MSKKDTGKKRPQNTDTEELATEIQRLRTENLRLRSSLRRIFEMAEDSLKANVSLSAYEVIKAVDLC